MRAAGVPFTAVLCDELYGRSRWLRHQLDTAGLLYLAEVPADTVVYLTPPAFGVPPLAYRPKRVRRVDAPLPSRASWTRRQPSWPPR